MCLFHHTENLHLASGDYGFTFSLCEDNRMDCSIKVAVVHCRKLR